MTPKEIGNPFQNFVSEVIGKPLPGPESFWQNEPKSLFGKTNPIVPRAPIGIIFRNDRSDDLPT
jgi:hypothetical protein